MGVPCYVSLGFIILCLSVLFSQNDRLRGYKGDFYVASVFVEDLSNPFVNSAKVLKLVSLFVGMLCHLHSALNCCNLVHNVFFLIVFFVTFLFAFYSLHNYLAWSGENKIVLGQWICPRCHVFHRSFPQRSLQYSCLRRSESQLEHMESH